MYPFYSKYFPKLYDDVFNKKMNIDFNYCGMSALRKKAFSRHYNSYKIVTSPISSISSSKLVYSTDAKFYTVPFIDEIPPIITMCYKKANTIKVQNLVAFIQAKGVNWKSIYNDVRDFITWNIPRKENSEMIMNDSESTEQDEAKNEVDHEFQLDTPHFNELM